MRIRLLLLSLAIVAFPGRELDAQSCMAADTASARIIARIRAVVTGTKEKTVQGRAMLHLPALSASQVTLVTDDVSCVRAREAQDSLVHATNPNAPAEIPARPLYVIKLGTYNAVVDVNNRMNGDVMMGFFDPNWAYLGTTSVFIGVPFAIGGP